MPDYRRMMLWYTGAPGEAPLVFADAAGPPNVNTAVVSVKLFPNISASSVLRASRHRYYVFLAAL